MISYQNEQNIDVEKIDDPVLLPVLRITALQFFFSVMTSSLIAKQSKIVGVVLLVLLPTICKQWNNHIINGRPLVLRRWLVPIAEFFPPFRKIIVGLDEIEVDEKVYYES